MGAVVTDLWPHLVTAFIAVIGTYFGAVHSLKVRVAILEMKVENLQKRVDSHSKKTDDILLSLSELKNEVSQKLGDIAVDIAKINTTLNIGGKT